MSAELPPDYIKNLEKQAGEKLKDRERFRDSTSLSVKSCTLTPAYGRDYKSKEAVLKAFEADKDFVLNDNMSHWDGKPINQPQLIEAGYGRVTFRYAKLRKCFVHDVKSLPRKG